MTANKEYILKPTGIKVYTTGKESFTPGMIQVTKVKGSHYVFGAWPDDLIPVVEKKLAHSGGFDGEREVIRRADKMLEAGKKGGLYSLVTESKVVKAIATCDIVLIHNVILAEMGIRASIRKVPGGVIMELSERHSHTTVMHACRSYFEVIGGIGLNRRYSIRVIIPKCSVALCQPNDQS